MIDPSEDIEHTVRQGRALVRAIEALEIIERLTFLEQIVIPLLVEWYRRRLAYLLTGRINHPRLSGGVSLS